MADRDMPSDKSWTLRAVGAAFELVELGHALDRDALAAHLQDFPLTLETVLAMGYIFSRLVEEESVRQGKTFDEMLHQMRVDAMNQLGE